MNYDAQDNPVSVDITITESKVIKMRERVHAFVEEPWAARGEVKEFAGLMSWAGSVVPTLKPYTQMLWGAAYSKPAGRETSEHLSTSRIKCALNWIEAMLDKHKTNTLRRRLLVHRSKRTVTITFDASLSGGGATWQMDNEPHVSHFITTTWSQADHECIKAQQGMPQHQAEWEAYMLLVAVHTWHPWLQKHSGSVVFKGDALGVLQDVLAAKARSPRLNLIIAEISLALCDTDHTITAEHLWSERNAVCDSLSRMGSGDGLPEEV